MERTPDTKRSTAVEVQEEHLAEGPKQPASREKNKLRVWRVEVTTDSAKEKYLADTEFATDSETLMIRSEYKAILKWKEELLRIRNKGKAQRELKKASKKKTENSSAIERLENAAKRYLEVQDEEIAPTEETEKLIHEAKKALEEAKKYWEKNKKSASEKVLEEPSVPEPPTSTKAAQPASAKKPSSDYLDSPGDRAGKDAQPVSVDGVGKEEI